jgi:hypothetical protein
MKDEQSMKREVKPPRMMYTKWGGVMSSCAQAILAVGGPGGQERLSGLAYGLRDDDGDSIKWGVKSVEER